MSQLLVSYLLLFVIIFSFCNAARILAVFPVPSHSHQMVFRPLTQELAKQGHRVVVITPKPAFSKDIALENLTEIDVYDEQIKKWEATMSSKNTGDKIYIVEHLNALLQGTILAIDSQLRNGKVKKINEDKNLKFDLVITEACVRPALIYSYIHKAPLIQISSLGNFLDTNILKGTPSHPLLYPTATNTKHRNLTIWETIAEIYINYKINMIYSNLIYEEDKVLQKILQSDHLPSVGKLNDDAQMIFFDINPMFEGIRPSPLTVVYTDALHIQSEKELPADLKLYLDSSKHGVIYISFGTSLSTNILPLDKIQAIVNTVSMLPYDVLWKWDGDDLPGRTENIKISKWLPQTDLLRHPKIKLFITQGGLQSSDEAVAAGVPLIGIPMMADQWYNAERYEYLKIGVKIYFEELNEEVLRNAIATVTVNNSFRQNIIKYRGFVQDQTYRPLIRAVKWIEYVLRHNGARHLRAPAANMGWFEYYEIQLILSLIGILMLALIIFGIIIKLLCELIFIFAASKEIGRRAK